MTTHDPIPARLAALKTTSTPDLKAQWRDLFDSEPPPFNRRYLESRLAYRIQELAYGGLKPDTVKRLEALGEQLDGGDRKKSRVRADMMPIVGTRLLREWQGVEHVVTVTAEPSVAAPRSRFVPVVATVPFSVTVPPTPVVDRPPAKLEVRPAAPRVSAPVLSKFLPGVH